MKPSLPPEPASGALDVTIAPGHYNAVRLGLLRLGAPLQTLLGKRGLEFHIVDDAWVCFDRRLGSQPALAWTDFVREGLTGPVQARALLYNSYASLFVHSVVPELAERLTRQVEERFPPGAKIVAFPQARR